MAGGNVEMTLHLNGTLIDSQQGMAPTSYSTVDVLLGELSGTITFDPAEYRYDDASLTVGGVEQLGNRGFESAPLTPYSPAVASGNWRPYRQGTTIATRATDIVRSGSYSHRYAKLSRNASNGYMHQQVSIPSSNFSLSCWVYRDAVTAPDGRASVAILFDWDRAWRASNVIDVRTEPDGWLGWSGFGTSNWGLARPADNQWNLWQINVYPVGKPRAWRHIGLVRGARG